MTAYYQDNIVAIATAPQNGAIGIVRVSGPEAKDILRRIFYKTNNEPFKYFDPRHFYFGKITNSQGEMIDEAMAVYMPGPNSFTGEDVAELHCHGNVVLLKGVVRQIINLSESFKIRGADPGEFTKRAFLNGKMDLTQAEAVQEIISAHCDSGIKASLSNLDGNLSNNVNELREKLCSALGLIEASFEFVEQDINTFYRDDIKLLIDNSLKNLQNLSNAYQTSKLYDMGVSVAIVGAPNVGKSSLLNAFLSENRAIVTEIAGTTRDVVEGSKIIDGVRFFFKDTAGLRESFDEVESVGIQKTKNLLQSADIVLLIFDHPAQKIDDLAHFLTDVCQKPNKMMSVLNKCDLFSEKDLSPETIRNNFFGCYVSAKTGCGLSELERHIVHFIHATNSVHNNVHINERQCKKINDCLHILRNLKELCVAENFNEELLAEELRAVIENLDEIIGKITTDAVLEEIFSRFCVGK